MESRLVSGEPEDYHETKKYYAPCPILTCPVLTTKFQKSSDVDWIKETKGTKKLSKTLTERHKTTVNQRVSTPSFQSEKYSAHDYSSPLT